LDCISDINCLMDFELIDCVVSLYLLLYFKLPISIGLVIVNNHAISVDINKKYIDKGFIHTRDK